jgi:hypothetical protein
MSDRKMKKIGANPMQKPKIHENSKPINTLGMMIEKMEEEPLKRDEFTTIRQFLRDKLNK